MCTILLATFLIGCVEDDITPEPFEPEDENAIIISGEYSLYDTLVIEEGQFLIIKPGSTVIFFPGAIIVAHGDLRIEGTVDMPIILHATSPIGDHRIITAKSGCKIFTLYHTYVSDGLITSYLTDNHFYKSTFTNSLPLQWDNAVARFWYGKVLIEECIVNWNNQGEGFLIHDNTRGPVIRNNRFTKVPDAVEFLHCKNGIIKNNVFRDMNDDGIDQNHCFNTLITDNEFYNIKDRALELGSEKLGSSDSLKVYNNLFVNCKVAINLKESSNAVVRNATFYNNGTSIDVQTDVDSSITSKIAIYDAVFSSSEVDINIDDRSEFDIFNSISDRVFDFGNGCLQTDIVFKDVDMDDYKIVNANFPNGLNANTIGYQK